MTSSYIPKEKKVKILYLIKIKEKIHNFGYDRKALANFENSNNKANQKIVIEKIIEKNITYGGQRLDKIYKENNTSQLGKYFKNWTSCGNHIPLSFVFVPDENKGNLDSEIGQLSEEERQIVSENYKILTYKDLYQFLVKNSEEIKKSPFGAKFYEDILEITKRMSESKRERTKRLFLAQIAKSFSK